MQFLNKAIITVTLLISLISFSQAETTWITKKKDKSKKVEKVEKNETVSSWIKKKQKENKKKFKEKKEESKTWISKKSKKEKKIEKKILKKYLEIANLPKANFYFTAKSENGQVVYGYVDSDKESDLMDLGGLSYFTKSNGYAYLDDGKTTCTVNSQLYSRNDRLKGDVVVVCKNKLEFSGDFTQYEEIGVGSGITNDGDVINFKFSQKKERNFAFYKDFVKGQTAAHSSPTVTNDPAVNPSGKYYALLIGNSKYIHWASLSSPKNDVKEIEKILNSQYNFEKVITVIDGTEKQIMKAFKKLSNLTSDKDYVLIYYSGHGDIKGNNSYWVPVDGEKEYGLGDWINISEIQNYIREEIPNHHIVLMSDSCYFAMETKGNEIRVDKRSQNFQKLLDRRTVMIVQSGSNEPVADISQDKHSMFGKSFILSLKNNESIIRMHKIIDNIQIAHSGMQQMPHGFVIPAWGHGGGDFLFIIPKK